MPEALMLCEDCVAVSVFCAVKTHRSCPVWKVIAGDPVTDQLVSRVSSLPALHWDEIENPAVTSKRAMTLLYDPVPVELQVMVPDSLPVTVSFLNTRTPRGPVSFDNP